MNQDDIIRLAKEANFDWFQYRYAGTRNALEDFANLVAAHEREACAKLCEDVASRDYDYLATDCAAAIRARGNNGT